MSFFGGLDYYYPGETFYLTSSITDSQVSMFLASRLSVFDNDLEMETLRSDRFYRSIDRKYVTEENIRLLESSFFNKETSNFFQLFKENNEMYFRIIIVYEYEAPELSFRKGYVYLGYTEKVINNSYGSLIDKLDTVYSNIPNSLKEYYINKPGYFQVSSQDFYIVDNYDSVKNIPLKDDNNVITIYLGKDKDYYFASTDLKIYKHYFCLEALSNNEEKVILKFDMKNILPREITEGDSVEHYFDRYHSDYQLFNDRVIIEKINDSSISIKDFSLQYDEKRMAKIVNLLEYSRSDVEEGISRNLWNKGESKIKDEAPYSDYFDNWLDSVHEAGYDDNDLV